MKNRLFYNFRKSIKFLGNKRIPYLCSMICCNVIGSICYNIVLAIVMKRVLDAVAAQNMKLFFDGVEIALVSFIIAFLFEPILTKMKNYCVRSMLADMRMEIVNSIISFPIGEYEDMEEGDLLTRITQDSEKVEQIYLNYIPNVCFALIHGGTAIVLMLYYDKLLGVLAILLGLFQTVTSFYVSLKVKKCADARQKSYGKLLKALIELLDGKTDIVMSHSQEVFISKFSTISEKVRRKESESELSIKNVVNIDNFFNQINHIILMVVGLGLVLWGKASVGTIAAIISLQGNASYLFQNFSKFVSGLANSLPSLERVIEVLKFEKEEDESLEDENFEQEFLNNKELALELKNISFQYMDSNKILNDISIKVSKGEFVLLMGESGCGKSTLAKLLLRFYTETDGEYYIWGESALQLGRKKTREKIAYLDQNSVLFSMSIMENLKLVREEASDKDVIEACKMADAHNFIMDFQEGYNHIINEDVNNLSGGQKQRLVLARMFLSNRPIFLIDEGTANLDEETERGIVQNLVKCKGNKTIIMITHNKQLIPYADTVYRLQNGKVLVE